MRAHLTIAGVLACGCHGVGDAGVGTGAAPGADAMRTAVVRPGDVVDRVLLTGVLHPVSAVELVAPNIDRTTLTIGWIVETGTAVKAGDRVVLFDDAPFSGTLQEGRARLREEERKFRLARDEAALGLEDKRLEVRRKRNDRDKAQLQAELPSDLTTERVAQGSRLALTQAEAGLAKAEKELSVAIAKAALEQRARQIDLDKTRRSVDTAEHAIDALVVKAPRDGVAAVSANPGTGHKLHAGDTVQDGTAIVSLPDLTRPMEVRADLIDVDDGRVNVHTAGTCTLDGYPADPLPCTVEALAPVARPKSQGSLRSSFRVTLALAHGDPARLRPGMAVKIELHRPPLHALVIPRGAVVTEDAAGGKLARVRLGTGEVREVTLAACDAQQCAVARGLSEGDVVASASSESLGSIGGRS